ncbi:MAG: PAS domain S-box protein [Chitinispirillaceae bacterium]|nr:PAS domain S-box protein [Chitinispirillaceae bacterium]
MNTSGSTSQNEQSRLASIIEGTRAGTWEWNIQTGETVFNEIWANLIGYTLEEISPVSLETWIKFTHPDDLEKSNVLLEQHFSGELGYYDCECRMRHKDGSWIWVNDRGKVISWTQDGKPHMMFGTHIDITERKKAEEALRESEERFRNLSSLSTEGIMIHADGIVVDANKAFTDIIGVEDPSLIIGKKAFQVTPLTPESAEKIREHQRKGTQEFYDIQLLRSDGALVDAETEGREIQYNGRKARLVIMRDISERKKMEVTLRNTQRLESLGVLAGGIAHDFNNLLGGIFGYIDLALLKGGDEQTQSLLGKAMGAIDRARALTSQLLTFAKGGVPVKTVGPLVPFLQETVKFALSGSNVSCSFEIEQDLWKCDFDKNQIGQVFEHIVLNAQEAMPLGGTVVLTASNISVQQQDRLLLKPGGYVKVVVRDSGIGIPPELLSRIFDPFFTTKSKGHGLGLTTCHSIVKRHNGYIKAESADGKGTVITVYLPAVDATGEAVAGQPVSDHRGNGTIIVADDEEVIRDSTQIMLESMGYTVICTADGKDALSNFHERRRNGQTITAMVLDLTIPGGMGGIETAKEIRTVDKDLPLFVASGYADDPVMANPDNFGFTGSISKPFRRSDLSRILDRYLSPAD